MLPICPVVRKPEWPDTVPGRICLHSYMSLATCTLYLMQKALAWAGFIVHLSVVVQRRVDFKIKHKKTFTASASRSIHCATGSRPASWSPERATTRCLLVSLGQTERVQAGQGADLWVCPGIEETRAISSCRSAATWRASVAPRAGLRSVSRSHV